MPQGTNNNPTRITTSNNSEPQRHTENKGNSRHERENPALPPIFVPGTTNMQQLTAVTEEVVNRSHYIWCLASVAWCSRHYMYKLALLVKHKAHMSLLQTTEDGLRTETCSAVTKKKMLSIRWHLGKPD
jgi:hypothetical protein